MNKLHTKYLEILSDHGLIEPQRKKSVGEAIDFIHSLKLSDSTDDREAAEEILELFSHEPFLGLLDNKEFIDTVSSTVLDKDLYPIISFYEKRGHAIASSIYFNEFPTHSFNAEIMKVDGGYLCLFNTGLLRLISRIGFCLLNPIEGTIFEGGNSGVEISLDTNIHEDSNGFKEAMISIVKLCHEFLIGRGIVPGTSYRPSLKMEPAAYLASAALAGGMKSFVISHELSHYVLGHLKNAPNCRIATQKGDIDGLLVKHQCEFAADLDALKTLLLIDSKEPAIVPRIIGSIAFFYIQLIIEMLSRKFLPEERALGNSSYSHPSSQRRISKIKNYLRLKISTDSMISLERFEYIFQLALTYIFKLQTITSEGRLKII